MAKEMLMLSLVLVYKRGFVCLTPGGQLSSVGALDCWVPEALFSLPSRWEAA